MNKRPNAVFAARTMPRVAKLGSRLLLEKTHLHLTPPVYNLINSGIKRQCGDAKRLVAPLRLGA